VSSNRCDARRSERKPLAIIGAIFDDGGGYRFAGPPPFIEIAVVPAAIHRNDLPRSSHEGCKAPRADIGPPLKQ